ncbi:MAG: carboxypeptidase-like regulatory domain-containing protein [Bacteroidales bacterium]
MKHHRQHIELTAPAAFLRLAGILIVVFLLIGHPVSAQEVNLESRITLPRQTTTIYSLLNQISRQTGYFFVYDSQLIDNNRSISIARAREPLEKLLDELLDDPTLKYRVLGNHILIYQQLEQENAALVEEVPKETPFVVKGRLLDQVTGSPLPFASVGIPERGIGISSNTDGFFQLKVPGSLINKSLKISYMGYKSQEIPLELMRGKQMDIIMETDYISMQEVIIRYYDPKAIVMEALEKVPDNYSDKPVYLLSFYREGVQRNNKFLNYSEAIFRVYKSPYATPNGLDQVLLLKARNITNVDRSDTLAMKLKAGVRSSFELDIVKSIPDFMDPESIQDYDFVNADLVTRNGRSVYAIEFKQKDKNKKPLFQGFLYVDMESLAFIGADFEMNPKYINRAKHRFITDWNSGFVLNMEKAKYTVSYQYFNGRYHLSHVRAELKMKIRQKNQFFNNNYSAFLEMAVCDVNQQDVKRFPRRESLKTHAAFIDQGYQYDTSFWGDYNIIAPERHISEALSKMQSKIESFYEE